MKRFLKLTSDFKNFTATFNENVLKFEWTCSLNLTSINSISLLNCQIYPLKPQGHGHAIPVFSNLIRGDNFNPRNEIACIFIPKGSKALPNYSDYGESSMTQRRLYKVNFRFICKKVRPS